MILLKDNKLGAILTFQPDNNTKIDLCWNWKSFGCMFFCYPENPDRGKTVSLQLLWPKVIINFNRCERT